MAKNLKTPPPRKYLSMDHCIYMTPDPGPPIPGYKGGNFGDEPEENEDELSERDIEENDE